jgi:glyoxylate/hydroxypyruvate reductase A
MPTVLFSAPPALWPVWRPHLQRACAACSLDVTLLDATDRPESIDYIVYAPGGPVSDFAAYPRFKAILSLWAGVERIAGNPTIRVPLCRMVDEGLTQGMVEWVAGHVLRYHLGLDAQLAGQDGIWRHDAVPPLARDRTVGVLGLGEIGRPVAEALARLGFDVRGWSRREKHVPGIEARSGETGLADVLGAAEILILLLPATPDTENLMDARRLALLPHGARLLNPGRGSLIDDAALLAALDAGRVGHATLDVFRTEPLPPEHRYWAHPAVTVTPHIASETRPATAAVTVARNIRRGEDGLPFYHTVDRTVGY